MPDPAHAILTIAEIHIPDHQRIRLAANQDALQGLADSIAALGLLNPISVTHHDDAYQLVAGGRRLAAYRLLGRDTIPARIIELDETAARAATIAENLHRAQLSPIEEAAAAAELLQHHDGHIQDAAQAINRTETWLQSRLDMLDWPPDLQRHVHDGTLSASAARALAPAAPTDTFGELVEHAARHGITAATARIWAQDAIAAATPPPASAEQQPPEYPRAVQYQTIAVCACCGSQTPLDQARQATMCDSCLAAIVQARQTKPLTREEPPGWQSA